MIRPNESPWERLQRIAKARLRHLGIKQQKLPERGGPSLSWLMKLNENEGPPSGRHTDYLSRLDRALEWPAGTSWSMVNDDRSDWSDDILEDEENSLVFRRSEVDAFLFMVGLTLRGMPDDERDSAMSDIARRLGKPVVGNGS